LPLLVEHYSRPSPFPFFMNGLADLCCNSAQAMISLSRFTFALLVPLHLDSLRVSTGRILHTFVRPGVHSVIKRLGPPWLSGFFHHLFISPAFPFRKECDGVSPCSGLLVFHQSTLLIGPMGHADLLLQELPDLSAVGRLSVRSPLTLPEVRRLRLSQVLS